MLFWLRCIILLSYGTWCIGDHAAWDLNDVVAELQRMQDSHQYWVEYALDQLNTVQQVATRFDGLQVHSWPDDELVRSTSGQLRSKLKAMQEAVSPESFSDRAPDTSPEQSELARDGESVDHLI